MFPESPGLALHGGRLATRTGFVAQRWWKGEDLGCKGEQRGMGREKSEVRVWRLRAK